MAADSDYSVQRMTTVGLPAAERTEYWRAHVRFNHGAVTMSYESPANFQGGTIVQRCGQHQLIEFWSGAITYRRSIRDVRTDDDRSLRMVVARRGCLAVTQGDRSARLTAGHAAVVTMAAPFEFSHTSGAHALVLSVPESCLAPGIDSTVSGDLSLPRGVGAIAAVTCTALAQQRDALSPLDFLSVSSRLEELVVMAARSQIDDRLGSVAQKARLYVLQRSDDPTVTPRRMAHELGWSLRQLQHALQLTGTTPARLLRDQRLHRARKRLQDPGYAQKSVSQIAFDSGFSSLSAFGAAFSRRYGTTPGAVRTGLGERRIKSDP